MPRRTDFESDGSGALLGSFIHKVLERGVNETTDALEGYLEIAKKLKNENEWNSISLEEANPLISIFWERNKEKIKPNSKTELGLTLEIERFKFYGLADRIDHLEDETIEIIDYKTNKDPISPKKRALQLGFYALALQAKGYKVSKLTLDMLKLDKPIEMEVKGDEVVALTGCNKTANFKLSELKEEIINFAKSIKEDYEHSFECTDDESNCKFCGYKFYCPKWDS